MAFVEQCTFQAVPATSAITIGRCGIDGTACIRQINESRLSGQITIATNSTQKDIIINQLGEDVDIVTEPERRDTFPAIALAAGYLSMAYSLIDLPVILCRMFCNVMKPKQLYSYLAVGLKRRGTVFI